MRKVPLGYVLASLLLVDVAATFLTLTATACLAAMWGQVMDPLVPLYVAMMFGSICSSGVLAKSACGVRFRWTAISVRLRVRCLPVRT